MIAQHFYLSGYLFAFRDDHAAVTITGQIFTGEKTKTSGVANCANFTAIISGAESLRAIFDNFQVVFFSNFHDGFHVGRMAE